MRIVLDTNVFISGVFWKGTPHRILSLWANHEIEVIMTSTILSEYLEIMKRLDTEEKVTKKWGIFILENSTMVKDKKLINICRDPDDNKFLNAAIIGEAKFIVSGDDDLLTLEKIKQIPIITPSQFLNTFHDPRHPIL